MPLTINLRHLETHALRLNGELPLTELDIETCDEVIQVSGGLEYAIEVEKLDDSLLLEGRLELPLQCQCVRCLKPFRSKVKLEPWTCHLQLEGEEGVPIINDIVDLTPYIREDILLEFPQHPLCNADCGGLPKSAKGKADKSGSAGPEGGTDPAWAELNKLNLDKI